MFKEYEHLLNQVHERIAHLSSLHPPGTKDTAWLLQRQQFLNRSSRNRLQFAAYLCSQGYTLLLELQKVDNITLEERILSLYMRFAQFQESGFPYPLVAADDLEFFLKQLCYDADLKRDFWASGVFVWGTKRLQQLGADRFRRLREFGLNSYWSDGLSDDEYVDETEDETEFH
jgi:hypothetical protein